MIFTTSTIPGTNGLSQLQSCAGFRLLFRIDYLDNIYPCRAGYYTASASCAKRSSISFRKELQLMQEAVTKSFLSSFTRIMPSRHLRVFPIHSGIPAAETLDFVSPVLYLNIKAVASGTQIGAYPAGLAGLRIFFPHGIFKHIFKFLCYSFIFHLTQEWLQGK